MAHSRLSLLMLALFEATLISLVLLALAPPVLAWPAIVVLVGMGWLADTLGLRAPPSADRPILVIGAVLAVWFGLALQMGGDPIAGLQLLLPAQPGFGATYLLVLLVLLTYWRGVRLDTHQGAAVMTLFGRGIVLTGLALVVGALFGTGVPLTSPVLLIHIVGLSASGMLALALVQARPDGAEAGFRLTWRWTATLLVAVGGVVVLATVVAEMLGGDGALAVMRDLLQLALLPFALLGAIITYVIINLFGPPIAAFLRLLLENFGFTPPAPPANDTATTDTEYVMTAVEQLALGATWLMALIPIVLLVLVIVLVARRRNRRMTGTDEERESLGVIENLGHDVRDLLASLRRRFDRHPEGLHAALARLHGNDPVLRVRRAYVRSLIALEQRRLPRRPAQTPAEYAVVAAESAVDQAAVVRLTTAYEHARYDPDGVAIDDAVAAEAAAAAYESR
jgi:hypothetical protein